MGLIWFVIVFLWGFAEATLFFVVPDVILTAIAIIGFSEGLEAALWALAGALLGGMIMYRFGKRNRAQALVILNRIPLIKMGMVNQVERDFRDKGIIAMIRGGIVGIPYKIFAVQAPYIGLTPFKFLLGSIPARLFRFTSAVALTGFICHVVIPDVSIILKFMGWGMVWMGIYIFYFRKFS